MVGRGGRLALTCCVATPPQPEVSRGPRLVDCDYVSIFFCFLLFTFFLKRKMSFFRCSLFAF